MASRRLIDLDTRLVAAYADTEKKFRAKYPDLPVPFLTATHRDNEEQNSLYAQGRTKPGKRVTNARGGQSAHNYNPSYAFDVAFAKPSGQMDWSLDLFDKFAEILLSNHRGITWGGNFRSIKDKPHFEVKGWKDEVKLASMKKTYGIYKLEEPPIKSTEVAVIQREIARQTNLKLVADGVFGKKTDAAVKVFQSRNGLKIDGVVGPATLKKLGL